VTDPHAADALELLGYTDRLSVSQGGRLRVMVSSEHSHYQASVIRLGIDDRSALDVPGVGSYPGRRQTTHAGSYVRVEHGLTDVWSAGMTVQAWIFPTLPSAGYSQGIVTNWSATEDTGWGMFLDAEGRLVVRLHDGTSGVDVRTETKLRAHTWYFVAYSLDSPSRILRLWQQELIGGGHPAPPEVVETTIEPGAIRPIRTPILLGAGHQLADASGTSFARDLYSGKIENPAIFARPLTDEELVRLRQWVPPSEVANGSVIAAWDFAADIASSRVVDTSPNGLHGQAVNVPVRAVTGSRWAAREQCFLRDSAGYSAMHFHPQDLEDAHWSPDFEVEIPPSLESGVYAVSLSARQAEYRIPFFVTPARASPQKRIVFLAPTFTYLAYGNDHMWTRTDIASGVLWPRERMERPDPADVYVAGRPDLGLSLYDSHADGCGCCHVSRLRPIVNMRDDYRYWQTDAPRHLSADVLLLAWLHRQGFQHDVLTDEELHHHGAMAITPYEVVITGSHPEYWSAPMIDGLREYLDRAGRLMYLGGNGFYWVTSVDPERPHVIEVRRGNAGTRNWSTPPGECYHSTTGEFGGLWRHRGIPPQTLVGVGFTANGCMGACGYARQPDSMDPKVAFIFEGVREDEIIGNFGQVLGGAAGDEIDRADTDLGTPPSTLLLASSFGHNESYQLCIEDMTQTVPTHDGTTSPLVRADMVYVPRDNGGAVFSVGSINWIGSLGFNGDDNNVSRITCNVLSHFASGGLRA
jgi:N,N-dimethylformamidase